MKTQYAALLVAGLLSSVTAARAASNPAVKNPADELPPSIKRVTHFGERADWSHDGKRILFLEKTFGDVYEVEPGTGNIRAITNHFPHHGVVSDDGRAMAFQLAKSTDAAGVGYGIFVLDLRSAAKPQ